MYSRAALPQCGHLQSKLPAAGTPARQSNSTSFHVFISCAAATQPSAEQTPCYRHACTSVQTHNIISCIHKLR
eukprot:1158122-Pelagomonas_calceolata.AAC.23